MSQKSLHEQREQRLKNQESLVERGFEAFPYSYTPTHYSAALQDKYKEATAGDEFDETVTIAGRVMLFRMMGKATFATLQDKDGSLQAYFQKDNLERYNGLKKIDLGDWLEVTGSLFVTKTGELTVKASDFRPLVKSIRPLPDKFHGLADKEQRYRQRYLDLMVNPEVKRAFMLRSKAISMIRRYLDDLGFIEERLTCLSNMFTQVIDYLDIIIKHVRCMMI